MMDPKSSGEQTSKTDEDVKGEGNYSATRRYREGLEQSVKKGNSEQLGEKAKEALEGPEAEELRKAEEIAKQGAHKPVSK